VPLSAMIFLCSFAILVGAVLVAYGLAQEFRTRESVGAEKCPPFAGEGKVPIDEPLVLDFKEEFSVKEPADAEPSQTPGWSARKNKRTLGEIASGFSASVLGGLRKVLRSPPPEPGTAPKTDLDHPSPTGTVIGAKTLPGSPEIARREG